MPSIEEVRKALDDYLAVGHADSTVRCYSQVFRRTVRYSPALIERINAPQAKQIRSHLANLGRRGHGASSLRFHFFFLKTLTENVMRGKWPMRKQDTPPETPPEKLSRPIFSEERITDMISKIKKKPPDKAAQTHFAVSTIYGARRVELGDLVDNINLDAGTIRIKTRKRGPIRTHIIPDEIKPHLFPNELEPLAPWKMSELFIEIETSCGFEHEDGYGWHSIRRRLTTWFDDHGVSEPDIYRFMRWRRRRTILDRYIVRTDVETDRRLAEVDRMIFEIHPFLSAWGS